MFKMARIYQKFSTQGHTKIDENRDFRYENIPSGNPDGSNAL
jgi:hypothetical protein